VRTAHEQPSKLDLARRAARPALKCSGQLATGTVARGSLLRTTPVRHRYRLPRFLAVADVERTEDRASANAYASFDEYIHTAAIREHNGFWGKADTKDTECAARCSEVLTGHMPHGPKAASGDLTGRPDAGDLVGSRCRPLYIAELPLKREIMRYWCSATLKDSCKTVTRGS
jgi:hypothetical protein